MYIYIIYIYYIYIYHSVSHTVRIALSRRKFAEFVEDVINILLCYNLLSNALNLSECRSEKFQKGTKSK
jgi:hypothetical protein